MFLPGYTDSTPIAQDEFRLSLQKLMIQGKLQRDKKSDTRFYDVIMSHQQSVKLVLRLFNATLITREEYGVLYIDMPETEDSVVRLAGGYYDLIIYLVLRREMELNRVQRSGYRIASITVSHLRSRLDHEYNRLKIKPISETALQTILKTMRQEDIIEWRGSLKTGDTTIHILPILLVLLSVERMENLSGYLQRAAQSANIKEEIAE